MIYVLKAGEFYKIGYTSGRLVEPRIKQLQVACPHTIELVDAWPGSSSEEASLHKRFAHLHERGEWFRLTTKDLEWIEGTAVMARAMFGYPKEPRPASRLAELDARFRELVGRDAGCS